MNGAPVAAWENEGDEDSRKEGMDSDSWESIKFNNKDFSVLFLVNELDHVCKFIANSIKAWAENACKLLVGVGTPKICLSRDISLVCNYLLVLLRLWQFNPLEQSNDRFLQ